MMQISLIADSRKPEEFQGICDYLIIADLEQISVGDTICINCSQRETAKVVAIWVSFVFKHIPVRCTESGHKHIIRLDRSVGAVPSDKRVEVEIASERSR